MPGKKISPRHSDLYGMMRIHKEQRVKLTYSAAAQEVAKVLIGMDTVDNSVTDIAEKVVQSLGFKR